MKRVVFLSVFLLGGCGATLSTQVSTFGETTSAITEKVDGVMDEYNKAALRRSFTDYAATFNSPGAPQLTSTELAKISEPITPDHKKTFALYRANKALGGYASALAGLANAAGREEIDAAAAQLYGSMVSLNEQYQTLKAEDAELFANEDFASFSTAVAAIGHAVVEKKRRDALKQIVTQADSYIARICDEMVAHLEAAGIEDSIATSRSYVLAEEIVDYNARVKPSSSLEWKRDQIERLYELQQDVFTSKLLVQQTQKALIAIKQAHAKIAEELAKDRFTSAEIAATIGRLKKLEAHYDDFEELLLSCEKVTANDAGVLSCDDK